MNIRKSLKFLTLSMLCSGSLAYAGLVNGISVIVDNEPITLYEIHKVSEKLKVTKEKALDLLVQKRLEDAQIKRLGITTDKFEVDERISDLATQNGLSEYEFLQFLKSKDIDVTEYKEELKNKIKQEKLIQRIFASKVNSIDVEDMKRYYESNKEEFTKTDTFEVVKYESANKESLQQALNSPMMLISDVSVKAMELSSSSLDPKTAYFLNQTGEGSFTPILSSNLTHLAYLVKAKKDTKIIPFEQARNVIESKLSESQREDAVSNYFEKLKAKADITVLRRP